MIKGFEEITKDLTPYEEQTLLPLLVAGTENHVGKDNPIINRSAVKMLKDKGYKISEARFRKLTQDSGSKSLGQQRRAERIKKAQLKLF